MVKEPSLAKSDNGADELVFLALGGLGEVGMNAYLYGYGSMETREWLLVDLGLTFPEGEDDPGVDVILPDLRFLETQREQLTGLIITHAHEDHIGAVLELWPRLRCKIYATPFTAGMLKSKASEFGYTHKIPLFVKPLDSRFKVGNFDIELLSVAHSIPETSSLIIRTELGTIYHTADWKRDNKPYIGKTIDEPRLKKVGDEGVLAVVSDSTNAMREGTSANERDVAKTILEIVERAPHRVLVTSFSSNVARIKACWEAAQKTKRRLIVAGRALHRVINVAIENGYLPEDFNYVDQQEFKNYAREEVLCLCTGSQGETRAAMARISEFNHPDISLDKGDLVLFSSRSIPGNERSIAGIQNALIRMGCDILTDNEALIHVTGHPRKDELIYLYKTLRPDIVVPMHGEARHLKANSILARSLSCKNVLTIYNGEIIRLAPGIPKIIDDAPVGRLFRDGHLLISESDRPVQERRKLAQVGIVIVSVVLSQKGGILSDPLIEIDGIPNEDENGEQMIKIIYKAFQGTLKSLTKNQKKEISSLEDSLRKSIRSAVSGVWGKKPICKVLISVL